MEDKGLQSRILKVVEENNGLTISDVSRALGIHYTTASKYLAVMEAEKKISHRRIGMAKLFVMNNGMISSGILKTLIILIVISSLILPAYAIPTKIPVNGRLTFLNDTLVNGTSNFTFSIFTAKTGGTIQWNETQENLSIPNGAFSALLGNNTPMNLSFDNDFFLQITVNNEVISPRFELGSAPYAYTANQTNFTKSNARALGDFLPNADNSINLGSQSLRWQNGNFINVNATGFMNATILESMGNTYLAVSGGSVGIGTAYPTRTLTVIGTANFTPVTQTNSSFQFFNKTGSVVLDIDTTNNRVGIGTVSPNSSLHVKGGSGSSGGITIDTTAASAQANLEFWDNGAQKWAIYKTTGNNLSFYSFGTGAGDKFWIDTSGRVGINTIAPTSILTVNGNITLNPPGGPGNGGYSALVADSFTSPDTGGAGIIVTSAPGGNNLIGTDGGAGGDIFIQTDKGGDTSGATGTGGAGGTIRLLSGKGGDGTVPSANSGAGGGIVLTAGVGGIITGGTAGAGGNIELTGGSGGNGNAAGGDIYLVGGPSAGSGAAGDVLLGITSGGTTRGKVGIGTISPITTLDVRGSVNVTGSINASQLWISRTDVALNLSRLNVSTTLLENRVALFNTSATNLDTRQAADNASVARTNADNLFTGNMNVTGTINATKVIAGSGKGAPNGSLAIADGTIFAYGTVGVTPAVGAGRRLMWIPEKASFRAGEVSATAWNNANIGNVSFAVGYDTLASGAYSNAIGYNAIATGFAAIAIGVSSVASNNYALTFGYSPVASGVQSIAIGNTPTASATNSIAIGLRAMATGTNSISIGENNTAKGFGTLAMGQNNSADGLNSIAFGQFTQAFGNNSIAIGRGTGNKDLLRVNDSNAFGIGFNATVPTLYVLGSSTANSTGTVGIGTTAPSSSLDIVGNVTINGTSQTGSSGITLRNETGGLHCVYMNGNALTSRIGSC